MKFGKKALQELVGQAIERMTALQAALATVDRAQAELTDNWSRSAEEAELDALRKLADEVRRSFPEGGEQ